MKLDELSRLSASVADDASVEKWERLSLTPDPPINRRNPLGFPVFFCQQMKLFTCVVLCCVELCGIIVDGGRRICI